MRLFTRNLQKPLTRLTSSLPCRNSKVSPNGLNILKPIAYKSYLAKIKLVILTRPYYCARLFSVLIGDTDWDMGKASVTSFVKNTGKEALEYTILSQCNIWENKSKWGCWDSVQKFFFLSFFFYYKKEEEKKETE